MRLIDADALLKVFGFTEDCTKCKHRYNDMLCESVIWRDVCDAIFEAPTIDAVPVVRCKDCVHGTDRTEEFGDGCVNPIACMMYSSDGEPDFFPKDNYCGFGERRDDE